MTCEKCLHFEMDTEPGYYRIGSKTVHCYLHRCEFDPRKVNGAANSCERYEDRAAWQTERDRKRYGLDNPVATVAGAVQGSFL